MFSLLCQVITLVIVVFLANVLSSGKAPDDAPGQVCGMTAQHAQRQGRLAARNVAASLGKGTARPYKHRDLGFLVDLGGLTASPADLRRAQARSGYDLPGTRPAPGHGAEGQPDPVGQSKDRKHSGKPGQWCGSRLDESPRPGDAGSPSGARCLPWVAGHKPGRKEQRSSLPDGRSQ
jgi:hypothetical protein